MHYCFISDLHLSQERPDITRAFASFMSQLPESLDTLYILGDFFDAWVGDDDDSEFVANISNILCTTRARGIAIKFVAGNRDFLLGEDFAHKSGMQLLPEISTLALGEKTAVLLHGDELCTRDAAYMALRAQVRNPDWQAQILSQPLSARRALAAQLRAQSAAMSSLKAADIMDVTPAAVSELMIERTAQIMIHGHTHRPARHSVTSADATPSKTAPIGERIVLGDWGTQAWCLEFKDGALTQRSWDIHPDT